mmetsp:Transcript_5463/g.8324  ORF Transcript_5463/g.8324 Transcript_5463/m.8324 type:complete len:327 (-) Transcript_5463:52-1032(-)
MVSTRRSRKKIDADSTTASSRGEKSQGIDEPENDQNNDQETDDSSKIDDELLEAEEKQTSSLEDGNGKDDTLEKIESVMTQKPQTTITTLVNTRKSKLQHSKPNPSAEENELTKLVPGYTAPLRLDTTGLLHQPKGGLAQLRRQAERTDASTRSFVCGSRSQETEAVIKKKTTKIQSNGFMPSNYTTLLSRTASFKNAHKQPAIDTTAGKGWFGMVPTPMTDELKTDLAILKNRNYLDPKRFYKKADRSSGSNRMMQVGTVIEGAAEFYSSRLAKKERRTNLTEEIMADPDAAGYTKRKYKSMQQAKSEAGRKRSKKLNKKGRKGY